MSNSCYNMTETFLERDVTKLQMTKRSFLFLYARARKEKKEAVAFWLQANKKK